MFLVEILFFKILWYMFGKYVEESVSCFVKASIAIEEMLYRFSFKNAWKFYMYICVVVEKIFDVDIFITLS